MGKVAMLKKVMLMTSRHFQPQNSTFQSPSTPYGDNHVTPESAVPREAVHKRQINCNGFVRNDGLYDIEAELTDHKTYPFPAILWHCHTRSASPSHDSRHD